MNLNSTMISTPSSASSTQTRAAINTIHKTYSLLFKNMDSIIGQFTTMFDHLESNKCMCQFPFKIDIEEIWYQMFQHSLKGNDFSGHNRDQLLCISFIRLTGETYINIGSKYQSACGVIQQLFKIFLSEDLWKVFIHFLIHSKDQYIVYAFIKAFSAILYASNPSTFSARVNQLLIDAKETIFEERNASILDFLCNLVDCNFKPCENNSEVSACSNAVPVINFYFPDLFQSLYTSLSQQWDFFNKQFCKITSSRYENSNIIRFLILWQKIVAKHLTEDLINSFLNEECVVAFLSNAYNMDVMSLRIYVDVIMKFFISSKRMEPSQRNCDTFEKALSSALDHNFFSLLPWDIQISGFCSVSRLKDSECFPHSVSKKCDFIIVKKVAFIFLNMIADLKNKLLLKDVVQTTFNFVKQNFDISPDQPNNEWILDVFFDQDDILLGVMLALLKIYINLKENELFFPECIQLQNSLNPHAIFICFLKRIGFDHNELLAFLTSDETCFLLYLVQYLKLLLKEWNLFYETHHILLAKNVDSASSVSEHPNEEESSLNISEPPVKKLLVSYSSSSSEDEFTSIRNTEIRCKTNCIQESFNVIKTLIKLKEAIKKLVDAREFPYNIMPLIALLQTCEHCSVSKFDKKK